MSLYKYNITVKADEYPGLICSSSSSGPDGKTQRIERRAKTIRRKGRL